MFTTPRVPCFLNTFAGYGDDPEHKELKLIFFIDPIEHDLALEISPGLADRLFRRIGGKPETVKEMPKASFSAIHVQMQNITFDELPQGGKGGVQIDGAEISNLRAAKNVTGDYRLEFDVVVPMDGMSMNLVKKYYKNICHLTMDPVQGTLSESTESADQEENQMSLQEAADSTSDPPADDESEEKPKAKKERRKKK